MKLRKKSIALLIALLFAFSAFTAVSTLHQAQAYGNYLYLQPTWYDSGQTQYFSRVYNYLWDGGWGIPHDTGTYPDYAIIDHTSDYLYVPYGGYMEARLYRAIDVYDESGNLYSSTYANFGTYGIWINTQDSGNNWNGDGYYQMYAGFQDNLYIGSNSGLNYYGYDGYPNALPQGFQHYSWDVTYWIQYYSFDYWGNQQDYTNAYFGHVVHDERSSTGTLTNWELSPNNAQLYAGSVQWTEAWPNQYSAAVNNQDGMLNYQPDNSYTELNAWSNGALARECVQLTGDSDGAYGSLWIYASTPSWSSGYLLTYTSSDGYNWNFLGYMSMPAGMGGQWLNLGAPTSSGSLTQYKYALFISYDTNNHPSYVYIDCVQTPNYW